MTNEPDVVIRTEQLTKRYPGGVLAVDGLDLQVAAGEIFGLLGPNGAGKTTTVGMLTSLVVPTSGRALVRGIDVARDPARARRAIGVVPQTNTLDRALTVRENLSYHCRYFGMSNAEATAVADELLSLLRLADRAHAPVAALSGGMAQRLMVGRAIAHNPSVLFLDEPTSGLDPQSRLALWDVMRELNAGGQTILLTTHYMEEADQLCDRLAIIDHGHLLALGTPDELKDALGGDVQIVLSSTGDPDALASVLRRRLGRRKGVSVGVHEGRARVSVKNLDGVLPQVVTTAEDAGFRLRDVAVNEPTLESVFIGLTGRDLRE